MKFRNLVSTIFAFILLQLFSTTAKSQTTLFSDNFEQDGFQQWNVVSGNWIRQYVNGSTRFGMILSTSSTVTEARTGEFNWTDYTLSFDMLPVSGVDRNIMFRVTDQPSNCCNWYNYTTSYGLHMYPNYLWLIKIDSSEIHDLYSTQISLSNNTVTHFDIKVEGNHIQVYLNNETVPTIDHHDTEQPILSGKISLMITTGAVYPTEVWYDNVTVTSLHTPVTKTVFAPGLMASWNADAILNCNPNTNTEWVLAPYAEEVYSPIIQAITESGWETIPYYYDWRKPVSENSQNLASFLSSDTLSNEKVNFVGHSMGGLIGRGYLNISDGEKLESLLTVGTPNTGSAYAYAPWEGGEIWSNSLIEKIALTIYLRHCGDIGQNDMEIIREEVPSIQDLLPTYPYLKRIKSDAPYLPNKNENLNSWITGLSSDSKGVRLGYIAGTGYETIETIQTKDPNKKDVREGLWEDGKPAGRISTNMGDGTVTASSAVLPVSDWSAVITQDHRGLVNSVEGMSKILEFLGTPNTSNISTEIYNPDSALVLIGYPGLFSVTDENGKIKQSKEGMVALMNPKSGNYKVNLLPKSENTLFIVAQFLPNGEVKYKEYNLKGLTPKFKTLKFDPQNPSEDILN